MEGKIPREEVIPVKKGWIAVSSVFVVLVVGGMALAHMRGSGGCVSAMGPEPMGWTVAPGMTSEPCMRRYGVRRGGLGCPATMNVLESVDHYLSYGEEIGLSEDQLRSLKSIRNSYQKETITRMADLQTAMLDLRNLLSEDKIDLSEARTLNKRMESIESGLRLKGIQAFAQAKRILTKEQLKKVRDLDRGFHGEGPHRPMIHR